jgi:hypothetical protein
MQLSLNNNPGRRRTPFEERGEEMGINTDIAFE